MTFDDLKKLQQKKYRQEYGFFLAEGEHLVLELGRALSHRPELGASRILVSQDYSARGLPLGFPRQLATEILNARQMSQLSETRSPQGVIAVVPITRPPEPRPGERAVYLHRIQDPGNLGTILRTLAWFGGFRCLLSSDSVDPYNAKVIRASMGAIYHVPVESEVSLATVSERYPKTALLDVGGQPLASGEIKEFNCFMFGSEAGGATTDMLSHAGRSVFSIPGGTGVESLNVATAVSMCVYEYFRQ